MQNANCGTRCAPIVWRDYPSGVRHLADPSSLISFAPPHASFVEVDGATHSSNEEVAYDRQRDAWFAANGYRVLRVTNEDVYRHPDGVCETILAWVEGRD